MQCSTHSVYCTKCHLHKELRQEPVLPLQPSATPSSFSCPCLLQRVALTKAKKWLLITAQLMSHYHSYEISRARQNLVEYPNVNKQIDEPNGSQNYIDHLVLPPGACAMTPVMHSSLPRRLRYVAEHTRNIQIHHSS